MTGTLAVRTSLLVFIASTACTELPGRPAPSLSALLEILEIPSGTGPRFSVGLTLPFKAGAVIRADNAAALRLAVALARTAAGGTPESAHDYAFVQLLDGNTDQAIATLEQLAASAPASSAVWSDLAGVYLLKADTMSGGAHEYWFHALNAAIRAIELSPSSHEAWFNRALAVERAGLLSIDDAWRLYAAATGDDGQLPHRGESDSAAGWLRIREQLENSRSEIDGATLRQWAQEFAGPLQEYLDNSLLPSWAMAVLDELRTEKEILERARQVADVLAETTGDPLPRDVVRVLQRARGSARQEMAEAHATFARSRRLFADDRFRDAASSLQQATATLRANGSPFWLWTQTYAALAFYYLGQVGRMDAQLATVIDAAHLAGYSAVQARALWASAVPQFFRGDIDGALRRVRASAGLYQASRQFEAGAAVDFLAAEWHRQLGDDRAAWTYLSSALARLDRIRDPLAQYQYLFAASLLTRQYDLPHASLFLQDAAIRAGARRGPSGTIVEGLANRADVRLRLGDRAGASHDLVEASQNLQRVRSPEMVATLRASLASVTADLLGEDRPDAAVKLLEQAVAQSKISPPANVPGLYLRLARLARSTGDSVAAFTQLDAGIATFEKQRAGVSSETQRVSLFEEGWELYAERLQLLHDTGKPIDSLFDEAEWMKGRVLRELIHPPDGPATASDLRQRLARNAAVVSYSMLPDLVLAWVYRGESAQLVELSVSPTELRDTVTRYRRSLALDRDVPDLARLSRRLFDALITPLDRYLPVGGVVAFVPDGILHAVPFSTLTAPDGRFLLERFEIVVAPNASILLRSADRLTTSTTVPRSALVIGDPAFDSERFPALQALTYARREAVTVGGLYERARTAVGTEATAELVRRLAGMYDVIHFAGHAVENPQSPWRSALLLAGTSDDDGLVYAEEIARWDLKHVRVVTLAACETGIGRLYKGEGVLSLATPFLAAGVPAVVSTLWQVEDHLARAVFERFHRSIAMGEMPSAALRRAQLAVMADNAAYRSPRHWGAYVVIGGSQLGDGRKVGG